jgi:hypothetical protein
MFKFSSNLNGENFPVALNLTANNEAIESGEALVFEGGVLTKADSDVKPGYISIGTLTPQTAGEIIPVYPIVDTHIYGTIIPSGSDGTPPDAPGIGDRVQISADGLTVTADTGGACEIISISALDDGSVSVELRFVSVPPISDPEDPEDPSDPTDP